MRNIEESELRLYDIRRMKKEGLITNNDVLRSEMQLTNDRLSLQETENSIVLVSQQLDILLGQDENVLLRPDTALLYRAVALQSYDDYIVQAYANNPVMKLLRAQTELARNEIRQPSLSHYPVYRYMHRIHWHALSRVPWRICTITTGMWAYRFLILYPHCIRTIIK